MDKDPEQKLVIYWNTKKLISLICAILIVPTLIVFLFSLTLKTTVINPAFYKSNLKKADTYDRLVSEGVPSLIMDSDVGKGVVTSPIAKSIVVYVLQKSIDPAWIESLVNATIDQVVKIFSTYSPAAPKVNLDLKNGELYLSRVSEGLLILQQLVPSCSDQSQIANCQKMSVNLDQIKSQIGKIQTKIDAINLSSVDIGKQIYQANSFIISLQKFVREVNNFFYGSLVILLALILAIIGLEYRKLSAMFKFISLPLVIGSIAGFLIIWPIKAISSAGSNSLNLDLPDAMNSIIADVIQANVDGIFQKFGLIAGIVLGIFVIVYVGVLILEKTNSKLFSKK